MQLVSLFHGHLHVADLFSYHDLTALLDGVEYPVQFRRMYLSVRTTTDLLDGPKGATP